MATPKSKSQDKPWYRSKGKITTNQEREKHRVIFTVLAESRGTPVEWMYEEIATRFYHDFFKDTPVEKIIWLKHYPAEEKEAEKTYRIFMDWNGKEFKNPKANGSGKTALQAGIPCFTSHLP